MYCQITSLCYLFFVFPYICRYVFLSVCLSVILHANLYASLSFLSVSVSLSAYLLFALCLCVYLYLSLSLTFVASLPLCVFRSQHVYNTQRLSAPVPFSTACILSDPIRLICNSRHQFSRSNVCILRSVKLLAMSFYNPFLLHLFLSFE